MQDGTVIRLVASDFEFGEMVESFSQNYLFGERFRVLQKQ